MQERLNRPTSHSLIERMKRFPLVRAISHIVWAIQKLTDAHFTIYNIASGKVPDQIPPSSTKQPQSPQH